MEILVNLDVMMAKRKISAGELAERVGITPANLSILKNNKAKAIRFSTLMALCHELRCQPGDLVTITGKPELLERLPEVVQRKLAKYRRFAVVSVDYSAPGWETAIIQPIGTKDRIACPARACIVN